VLNAAMKPADSAVRRSNAPREEESALMRVPCHTPRALRLSPTTTSAHMYAEADSPRETWDTTRVSASTPAPSLVRLLGLSLAALAVFLVELTLMRAVAQVTWPPFAFLALSAAMLGGGFAGTLLVVRPDWARASELPAVGGIVVGVGAPIAMAAVLLSGLEPLKVGVDGAATLQFVVVLLVLALPFVGLALSLSAMLLEYPAHAQRLYGADLVGAAIGSFTSVALLDAAGTAASGAVGAVLGALSALMLARSTKARALALAVVVAGVAIVPLSARVLPRPTTDKRVGNDAAGAVLAELSSRGLLHTVDGADGRVDVLPARPAPAVLIDLGAAVTRAPLFPSTTVPNDAAAAAFIARSAVGGDTLVIGSGAGFEVARALLHGAAHVDAVEVSTSVVRAATDGSIPSAAAVYADPRVSLHLEEARSFLEQQQARGVASSSMRRWRHIVAVHTISNAAVTVNAMRLAEDFLLTRESMRTMLKHLDDDGVLYMTRPAGQIDLLADLARDALTAEGIANADEHLAELVRDVDDPFFRGLLVSRTPLDRTALAAPTAFHWRAPPAPTHERLPTDERPFFHRQSNVIDDDADARLQIEGPALAERAVLWVGLLSVVLSAAVIVLPLWWRRRRSAAFAEPAPSPRHMLIAALLGVGFMCLELSLAQRMTLLCGRPAVAFAAVVGGMLLGAGVTGLLVSRTQRQVSLMAALLLSTIGAAASLVAPSMLEAVGILTWASAARAVAVAVVAAVLSAPLGLGFPGLVASASRLSPSAGPWLYGLNATTSVGAAALHAWLAPGVGLPGTTLFAAACYGVAAFVAWRAPQATPDAVQGDVASMP
jgi:hypothetical protein